MKAATLDSVVLPEGTQGGKGARDASRKGITALGLLARTKVQDATHHSRSALTCVRPERVLRSISSGVPCPLAPLRSTGLGTEGGLRQ